MVKRKIVRKKAKSFVEEIAFFILKFSPPPYQRNLSLVNWQMTPTISILFYHSCNRFHSFVTQHTKTRKNNKAINIGLDDVDFIAVDLKTKAIVIRNMNIKEYRNNAILHHVHLYCLKLIIVTMK